MCIRDRYNGDEDKIKEFIGDLYKNVLVLDTGARGATTSFVENGQGDVPVSYTHLDVYKRQDLWCGNWYVCKFPVAAG